MVGKSGTRAERSRLVMARARSLPSFTNGKVPGTFSIMKEIWPATRSGSAGADAARAVVQRALLLLGVGDELLHRFHRQRGMHHQHQRRGVHLRDRQEVRERIEGHVRE